MTTAKQRKFKVIGLCRVAGVEPGGEVTEAQLVEAGANIEVLIGPHLEQVSGPTDKANDNK